ncbi:aldo/keto reductase [Paenibacillus sp. WQ 127069]|uniref:Aldo/keto reductase n=1 Tax=Paenibacillus baimaensis TaxID=2982185 RepID=A0ABT2UGS1_9BACL|nr:aldo/keto reductase [Paenibacillus sp. WQ 127069]MCU6793835.1 aldo/keto reductase [Paenibacillus sp. WQ 127069]
MIGTAVPYIERNGLKLSRYMLGTAQLGLGSYGINNRLGTVDGSALLEYCEHTGINCYDTAHEYGDAELKLGRFFIGKQPPFIASKLKVDLHHTSELELERQMVQTTERIICRLKVDSLSALMIHDPVMLQVYGDKVNRILHKLQKEGFIQRAGISFGADPVEQYAYSAGLVQDDIFDMVQLPLNLFDRRMVHCGALDDFTSRGKWIVVRSVFLQGLFFLEKDALPEAIQADGSILLETLHRLALEEGISVAELAMSYVRDLENVHCLVIGAETPEQIQHNLELLNRPALSERTRERVEQAFADIPRQFVDPTQWNK